MGRNIQIGVIITEDWSKIYYYIKNDNAYVEFFRYTYDSEIDEEICYYELITYEDFESSAELIVYQSVANELQSTIVTWYNALRRIALVGLLSVLVYIGIQIILTSASGKENSKYKKMLVDWLVAICLLFTLHYLMSITITATQKVSDMFDISETDTLLNTIRGNIANASSWGEATTNVIMYAVLTIFTVTFTFQYLKRVLYMAFFTMIAPLITLTYPLDKIKDSKAQAFTMWLREYVFNALIQVVHLVVYFTLVSSAINLAEEYPIYAVIAIGFITQGEKIIRKMFGFENATTLGTVEAMLAGGVVTNIMNKLKKPPQKPKNNEKSEQDTSSNVRTTKNNPLSGLQGTTGKGKNKGKTLDGVSAVVGKYGKMAGKTAVRIGGGAAGAMLGFAGGVAQGDVGAALTGGAAGFGAGKSIGDRISRGVDTKGIRNAIDGVKDTWNKGAYGTEFSENAKSAREFKRSSAYKDLKEKFGDDLSDENLRTMLGAGINDPKTMEKLLGSGVELDNAMKYYTIAKKLPPEVIYNKKMMKTFCKDLREKDDMFENQSYGKIRSMVKKFM